MCGVAAVQSARMVMTGACLHPGLGVCAADAAMGACMVVRLATACSQGSQRGV